MSVYQVNESLDATSGVMKAAGERSRLRILKALEVGEMCVCHLTALLEVSQPTVSRHMAALKAAGLVAERREDRWIHYRLEPASPFADHLLASIRRWGQGDPVIAADRERVRGFLTTPVSEFSCSRG